MRKLLFWSILAMSLASATGCGCSHSMCGWRPGQLLFGRQQQMMAPMGAECCDPCSASMPVVGEQGCYQ